MDFKDNLKQLRNNRHLSQMELAEALGTSKGIIGMYETGKRKPSYEMLEVIADFFNVSIDYLMGNDDKSVYYLSPETAGMAQMLLDRPELKVLFDAAKDADVKDIEMVANILEKMKG